MNQQGIYENYESYQQCNNADRSYQQGFNEDGAIGKVLIRMELSAMY